MGLPNDVGPLQLSVVRFVDKWEDGVQIIGGNVIKQSSINFEFVARCHSHCER